MAMTPIPIRYRDPTEETEQVQAIAAEVAAMLMGGEEILYIAIQSNRAPTLHALGVGKRQAVVATSHRLILYLPTLLGALKFVDVPWMDVKHVHMDQGWLGTGFLAETVDGRQLQVPYLDKEQAKRLYSIAQQMEETLREPRRQRELEETRARMGGTFIGVPTPAPIPPAPAPVTLTPATTPAAATEDPVAKLAKAKTMLDNGLISQEEYDTLKTKILSSI